MFNVGHNVAMALGGPRWSLKRAHLVSTAVFDNEHSFTFADGGNRLPDQPGDGRLVCRAVADNLGMAAIFPITVGFIKPGMVHVGMLRDELGCPADRGGSCEEQSGLRLDRRTSTGLRPPVCSPDQRSAIRLPSWCSPHAKTTLGQAFDHPLKR
jgi:hypothetical protein